MGLTLTVLGSCGGYPGPGRAASSYLVEGGGVRLWLDAGSGGLANLQRHVPLSDLDAVVISHRHADHWHDIEGLAVASRYDLGLDPIPIFAPRGLRALMLGPADAYEWNTVADADRVAVGGLELTFSRTDHGPETLAVRVEGEGAALGYSADTGPGWSLEALGPDLDLALCEATYTQDHETTDAIHMSGREAGRMAREAGARRLVVTHRWAKIPAAAVLQEAADAFAGPVGQAEVGRGFSL